MASTSHQLSRYQPVVLTTVVAAAAGYGVYLLFASRRPTQNPSLHRSNAVHRPRRDRASSIVDHIHPLPDSPLGTIVLRRGDRGSHHINLATTPIPTVDELHELGLFSDPRYIRREMELTATVSVLVACFIASHHTDNWRQVEQYGFQSLLEAMAVRDEARITLHSRDIPRALRMGNVDPGRIAMAVSIFLESPKWREECEIGSEADDPAPAETEEIDVLNDDDREPSQGLRGLLYYIAEEDAKRKAYEHRGITCEECGEFPIRGTRWHCLNCADFDLCSTCEQVSQHPKTHVFAKIKIPLPILSQPTQEFRLWYPGDPHRIHKSLDVGVKRRLCQESGFEDPQMDALYDQYICIANVPNPSKSPSVEAAMDRRAFNKAMSCEKWSVRFAANALHDRMWFFYDVDGNGIIDFEEFVKGMAYLRGPRRYASLDRAIRGFDMDGDGYVDRSDFLRILRAKYDIQKQLTSDMIDAQEANQNQRALEVLRSSQPISSIFTDGTIPAGEELRPRGKALDSLGDMQPLDGTKTILDNDEPWMRTAPLPSRHSASQTVRPAQEHLSRHLSRFEEMLHGNTAEERPALASTFSGRDPSLALGAPDNYDLIDMGWNHERFEGNADEPEGFDTGVDPDPDPAAREPHVQDILWKVQQNGINELLDFFFHEKEKEEQEALDSSLERIRWRADIDAAKKEREEEVARHTAAAADPLVAQAMGSDLKKELHRSKQQRATGNIVPTDWESLERREQDIDEAPLTDLLDLSGYSVRETDDTSSSPRAAHTGSSSIWNGRRSEAAVSPLSTFVQSADNTDTAPAADPTLPQNRPSDEIPASKKTPTLRRTRGKSIITADPPRSSNGAPSKQRLLRLSALDDVAKEIEERGGIGRLTYDEIEETVVEGPEELRGLVKGWLEWASF